MQFLIENVVINWFIEEYGDRELYYIHLYPRYGGLGNKHRGYSLGMSVDDFPYGEKVYADGKYHFFINESDDWYFSDTKIEFKLDANKEIQFDIYDSENKEK